LILEVSRKYSNKSVREDSSHGTEDDIAPADSLGTGDGRAWTEAGSSLVRHNLLPRDAEKERKIRVKSLKKASNKLRQTHKY
jgi:hypothetical protein